MASLDTVSYTSITTGHGIEPSPRMYVLDVLASEVFHASIISDDLQVWTPCAYSMWMSIRSFFVKAEDNDRYYHARWHRVANSLHGLLSRDWRVLYHPRLDRLKAALLNRLDELSSKEFTHDKAGAAKATAACREVLVSCETNELTRCCYFLLAHLRIRNKHTSRVLTQDEIITLTRQTLETMDYLNKNNYSFSILNRTITLFYSLYHTVSTTFPDHQFNITGMYCQDFRDLEIALGYITRIRDLVLPSSSVVTIRGNLCFDCSFLAIAAYFTLSHSETDFARHLTEITSTLKEREGE